MATVRKVRWFWSWNDEQEEMWLRDMSARGMHLMTVEPPFFYEFERGESAEFIYRLDTPASQVGFGGVQPEAIDEVEYQQIFEDAGWTYIGDNQGIRYFRRAANNAYVQEIYTDTESKIELYRRRLFYQLALLLVVLFFMLLPSPRGATSIATWLIPRIAVILLLTYPMLQLRERIRKLQNA